jgi:uridine phosphorylase
VVVVLKKEFPILEFDNTRNAIIEPKKIIQSIDISENVVMCFFKEVIERLKNEGKLKVVTNLKSEMGLYPIYEMQYANKAVTLFHPGLGAPFSAELMEKVIALGCKKFIACGGAGVLDKTIAVGHVIVPISAIRDEGTSYHYLPPSREVQVKKRL